MSNPIVSVLIPTRGRIQRLNQAIASIVSKTPAEHFEILLRFDDDDWESKKDLQNWPNTFSIHGPRLNGYLSLHDYYNELALKAAGDWLAIWNDDATLSESGYWTEQLAAFPKTGAVAHPEWHILGKSRYHTPLEQYSPFPLMPRSAMAELADGKFCSPTDIHIDQALRVGKGWQSLYVKGMCVDHDRKIDETLPANRY